MTITGNNMGELRISPSKELMVSNKRFIARFYLELLIITLTSEMISSTEV